MYMCIVLHKTGRTGSETCFIAPDHAKDSKTLRERQNLKKIALGNFILY